METTRQSEYPVVDGCRLLFACCVFLLHSQTRPYIPGFPVLSALLLRLALPYFFVASGFFWGRRLYAAPSDAARRAYTRRVCLRLGKKLLLFEPIVIAMRCCTALLDGWDLPAFAWLTLREIVLLPRGGYWYMQALIVDMLLLLPLVRRGREEWAILPALLLYGSGSLALGYGAFAALFTAYCRVFLSLMNGLFFGLVFVLAGLLIAKYEQRLRASARLRRFWPLWLAAAYALLLLEALSLRPGTAKDWDAMFLANLPLVPLLFVCTAFCIRLPLRRPLLMRRLSTSLYLLHVPLVWGWTGVLRRLNLVTEPRANAFLGASLSLVSFALGCWVVYRRKLQPFYDWVT